VTTPVLLTAFYGNNPGAIRATKKEKEDCAQGTWSKNKIPLLLVVLPLDRLKGLIPSHSCLLRTMSTSKNLHEGTRKHTDSYDFEKKRREEHSNQLFLD
jgi:hypothetical protein